MTRQERDKQLAMRQPGCTCFAFPLGGHLACSIGLYTSGVLLQQNVHVPGRILVFALLWGTSTQVPCLTKALISICADSIHLGWLSYHECVRVLDSTGLVTEAGVGQTGGVEVAGEEGAVAMTLSSVEAEPGWGMARPTRTAWQSRRWNRSGFDGSFLPLNRRCGHMRVMKQSGGQSGRQAQ